LQAVEPDNIKTFILGIWPKGYGSRSLFTYYLDGVSLAQSQRLKSAPAYSRSAFAHILGTSASNLQTDALGWLRGGHLQWPPGFRCWLIPLARWATGRSFPGEGRSRCNPYVYCAVPTKNAPPSLRQ
jgi:hypothetical protein